MKTVVINLLILTIIYWFILKGWLSAIKQAKESDKTDKKLSFKVAGWGGVFGAFTTYIICVVWVYLTLDNGSLMDAIGLGSVMGLAIGLTGGNLLGIGVGYLIGKNIERFR